MDEVQFWEVMLFDREGAVGNISVSALWNSKSEYLSMLFNFYKGSQHGSLSLTILNYYLQAPTVCYYFCSLTIQSKNRNTKEQK